jgi:hypothetical protein
VEGTVFGPHIVVLKENLILYKPKLPQRDRWETSMVGFVSLL